MSGWTLILLTSERLISVWLPFKCKELCSRRRVIVVWTVIALLLLGANLHFLVFFRIVTGEDGLPLCGMSEKPLLDFFNTYWYWIDGFLGVFIPFIAVFTGNCLIVAKIVTAHRQRTEQMHATDNDVRKVTILLALRVN